jgi:exodeoxyribonuclease (lambda-induced)
LVLWAPDLESAGRKGLHIVRIERDEDAIEKLEADLMAFAVLVQDNEDKLRLKAA